MGIDAWLPEYDFVERHATRVSAPREKVWASLLALDAGRLPWARLLMGLRALPALLTSPRRARTTEPATLRGLLGGAFAVLEEDPPEGIVLGVTGRFWRLRGGLERTEPERFREPPPAGSARAAWSFALSTEPDGATRVATETRVRCADPATRRAFGRYWRVIRPGSGLIRREILRAVRRDAERVSP